MDNGNRFAGNDLANKLTFLSVNMKNFNSSMFFFIWAAFFTSGCGDSSYTTDWADVGYSDGYAVGYNTTCNIRATLIEGKWDNSDYSEAYYAGYKDGERDCKVSR